MAAPAVPDLAAARPMGGGIGVLVVNLGTPDAPDAAAVRRYLREFLADPRVIEDQGALWKLVLHGIILPTDLTLMFKALITLEGSARKYDPDFRLVDRLRPFVDRAMAARYADEVLVMRRGRAVAGGRPAEVLASETVEAAFEVRLDWQDGMPAAGLPTTRPPPCALR